MKRIKRLITVVIVLTYVISCLPIVASTTTFTYDPDAAIAFAKSHCATDAENHAATPGTSACDNGWLCAEFVSECLIAGGFPHKLSAVAGMGGFAGQIINYGEKISSSKTGEGAVKMSTFDKPLSKGDPIVLLYGYGEGSGNGHIVIYSGETESDGTLKVYAHNIRKQNEKLYADSGTVEIFAVHINNTTESTFFDFWGVEDPVTISGTHTFWLKHTGYGDCDVNLDLNGTALGTIYPDENGLFSFSLDSTKYANGTYTLGAVIRNASGAERYVTRTVVIDNPYFDFWNYEDNTAISGTYKFWWKQTGYGDCSVNLDLDGTALGTIYSDENGLFSYSLDTTKYENGQYTLSATITDTNGLQNTVSRIVTIDNPFFDFWNYEDNTAISGTYSFWWKQIGYSDCQMRLLMDGVELAVRNPDENGFFAYSMDTTQYHNGQYSLEAILQDANGTEHCVKRTVLIENPGNLGHILTQYDAKEPTCTEIGWYAYEECSVCDYTTYEERPVTGHTYESVVTEPTYETSGYTTHTCSVCGDSYVDSEVPPLEKEYVARVAYTDGTSMQFETLKEALYSARYGDAVTLLTDTYEEDVQLRAGVLLDLQNYTLTTDFIIGLKGSAITATLHSKADVGGKLVVPQDSISLSTTAVAGPNTGYKVFPVWNEDHYVFAQVKINEYGEHGALTLLDDNTAKLEFLPNLTSYVRDNLFKTDGCADNDVSIIIRVSWTESQAEGDIKVTQEYFYTTSLVQVAMNKISLTATTSGCDTKEGLEFTIAVVTEAGTEICSQTYVYADYVTDA